MKTKEIAEFLGGELIGDGEVEIVRVAAADSAKSGEIAFVEKNDDIIRSKAACLLVLTDFALAVEQAVIKTDNPKLALSRIAAVLHPRYKPQPMIHSTALVRESASVGDNVIIEPFVCIDEDSIVGNDTYLHAAAMIGRNVRIGNNCEIHSNVVIRDNCTIGDNVILHAGVIIGADGFGYVKDDAGNYHQFPQIGTVVIEDNVDIGANSCIDRGALGETRIGEGTKIDNLVQIAHNVRIGKRVVIAAQTGISGSTVIEDDCVIGGQVGMGDHALVKSGAVIGSQAGILPGKIVRPGVWWGTPVQPLDEYKRQHAQLKGISRLFDEVRSIRSKISRIESDKGRNSED